MRNGRGYAFLSMIVLVGLIGLSRSALALERLDQNENGGHAGPNLSIMVGPGYEGAIIGSPLTVVLGAALSYKLQNQFEFGIEYASTGGVPTLGGDVNYFFLHHFFVGIQFGLDFDSPEPTTFYIGPQAGFDYPIMDRFYIGPEIQYLYTIHDRGGIFEALANLKYYF